MTSHGANKRILAIVWILALAPVASLASAQSLERMRLGYSGTGLNNYVLDMGKRQGFFRKNGLDMEIVYVNSGSLLSQALIAGTFDLSFSQGSEAMIAKLRGADVRIAAVIANRFNHVYLAAPSITSIKQLKGKRVAVSRFGSGSHFQTNLALSAGGLDPEKDVTVLQIGNSGARIAAILSGVVDGTIMAADFVPRAKREGFNVLADLADTKIEYPFLSLNFTGAYLDRNRITLPHVGAFPTSFTNYNFIAVGKLLAPLRQDAVRGAAELERDAITLPLGEARTLVDELAAAKRMHISELEKLA